MSEDNPRNHDKMSSEHQETKKSPPFFDAPEMGVMAHMYRGELYRSKMWRHRLDMTTNWAVGTTGIALSIVFSNKQNSPVILILVTLLVAIFLRIESRRYRYFDIWRTRVRLIERCFFGPMLRGEGVHMDNRWNEILADDLAQLRFHITYWEAMGRRIRRNYGWIFLILAVSYIGKVLIHPTPLNSLSEFFARAAIGPIPGEYVILAGAGFNLILALIAIVTIGSQQASGRVKFFDDEEDEILNFSSKDMKL